MKKAIILFFMVMVVLANDHAFGQLASNSWTATVKVIGEDGNPIVGADVSAQYTIQTPLGSSLRTYDEVKGITDNKGIFIASHTDSSFDLGIVASKAGYYATHIGHQFYFSGQFDKKAVAASRTPSFTLMLKKIEKPIAMYSKQIDSITFPLYNKAMGYDLMVGDWVAPYGEGVHTDILFTENHPTPDSDYTFTVSFPNPGDGIQRFSRDQNLGVSDLQSLHDAPIDGYQARYEQTKMADPNRIFYFRVRTILDHQGHIVSARYGKIYGDFMQFRFYLNPTPNSRNVEFDPKQNLLRRSNFPERVGAP